MDLLYQEVKRLKNKQFSKKYEDAIQIMNQTLDILPKEHEEAFCSQKFIFQRIPAEWNILQHMKRSRKFISDKHRKTFSPVDWVNIFYQLMAENEEIKEKISELQKIINSISKLKKSSPLSMVGLTQMLRRYSITYRHLSDMNEIIDRIDADWGEFEIKYPFLDKSKYIGILYHFRSDINEFNFVHGIKIRRISEEEYNDLLVLLSENENIVPETWSEINFILEIPIKVIEDKDDFDRIRSIRTIIDIIGASCSGNVWCPRIFQRIGGGLLIHQGTKGEHFRGRIGIVPSSERDKFINRVNFGIRNRKDKFVKLACRSIRQEFGDTDYCLRLAKLYHILENLLCTTGLGAGTRLVWLIENNPGQRKELFKKFSEVKKLRDRIIHKSLFYDFLSGEEMSDVLDGFNS